LNENLNETNQAVEEETPAETPAEGAKEAAAPEPENAPEGEETAEAAAGEEGTESGDEAEGGESAEAESAEGEDVRRAEFSPISGEPGSSVGDNLDLILGVTVPVTIELGSTEMYFRDIMNLGPGSVVRLDRPIGEPVDLLVNGERVGRGEVVVADERYGVRVTELCGTAASKKEEE